MYYLYNFREEKEAARNSSLDVVEEDNEFDDDDDFALEFEDHTKMKVNKINLSFYYKAQKLWLFH